MNKQTLSQTNPYLRDRKKRLAALVTSVASSSAIEGIVARDMLTKHVSDKAVHGSIKHHAVSEQSHH